MTLRIYCLLGASAFVALVALDPPLWLTAAGGITVVAGGMGVALLGTPPRRPVRAVELAPGFGGPQ